MATKVSDFMLSRLREWDVEQVFAYAGTASTACSPLGPRGQRSAVRPGTARGDGRLRGGRLREVLRPGRRLRGNVGPGAIHLLNGLYDAKLDHVPVVAIVGQTNRSAMGGSYQQEVDLLSLYKDVASEYCEMVTVPEQLPNVLDRAIRVAPPARPTAMIVPADVQELEYSAPTQAFWMVPSSLGLTTPEIPRPRRPAARGRGAEQRGQGRDPDRPGRARREDEVMRSPTCSGPGWPRRCSARTCCRTTCRYVTGSIGLLGTRPSYELMQECDTLLTIGSSFPVRPVHAGVRQARAVQIEIDPFMAGLRYPFEVNLVGDSRDAAARLSAAGGKEHGSWRAAASRRNVARWGRRWSGRPPPGRDGINPELVVATPSRWARRRRDAGGRLGLAANWYARHSGCAGRCAARCPAPWPPWARGCRTLIGAKFAHPDRPAVGLVGDGAMQMNGIEEIITAAKYWREWSDPRLVIGVLNNQDLNQVAARGGQQSRRPARPAPDGARAAA